MNATINLENKHFPVLLNELISIISPLYGGTFIDCTFGQGGYSEKILENKKNDIIALDRDNDVLFRASKLKKKYNSRFKFYNIKFSQLDKIKLKDNKLKGIIFDLGYSLNQIKNSQKGLSFLDKGKLNMKMGINDISANEIISNMDENNLIKVFKIFGDESYSKKIVREIVKKRKEQNIKTEDLVQIIDSVKKYQKTKIHNSTKVFQALRILVNKEISELINALIKSFRLIPIGGIIAVVTFHSIEDRIVKFFFKHYSEQRNSSRYLPEAEVSERCFKLINKKPILPSESEIKQNPPSRSAKLRYGIKTNDKCDFTDFREKFKNLTDVEDLR
jgi:16S rRNA (cytosine1402-N4)-methyltransferase